MGPNGTTSISEGIAKGIKYLFLRHPLISWPTIKIRGSISRWSWLDGITFKQKKRLNPSKKKKKSRWNWSWTPPWCRPICNWIRADEGPKFRAQPGLTIAISTRSGRHERLKTRGGGEGFLRSWFTWDSRHWIGRRIVCDPISLKLFNYETEPRECLCPHFLKIFNYNIDLEIKLWTMDAWKMSSHVCINYCQENSPEQRTKEGKTWRQRQTAPKTKAIGEKFTHVVALFWESPILSLSLSVSLVPFNSRVESLKAQLLDLCTTASSLQASLKHPHLYHGRVIQQGMWG